MTFLEIFKYLDIYVIVSFILLLGSFLLKKYQNFYWKLFRFNNLLAAIFTVLALIGLSFFLLFILPKGQLTDYQQTTIYYLFLPVYFINGLPLLFFFPRLRASLILLIIITISRIFFAGGVFGNHWFVPLPNTYGSIWVTYSSFSLQIQDVLIYLLGLGLMYYFFRQKERNS